MKKNTFIATLLITLCTSLSIGNTALASETTAQDKVIAESTQKLAQLKETKQQLSQRKNDTTRKLADLKTKSNAVVDQSEKNDSLDPLTKLIEQSKTNTSKNSGLKILRPMDQKKERLNNLKQQQLSLSKETETLTNQQNDLTQQENQLSEKIELAKRQKEEQSKQQDTRSAVVAAAKNQLGKPYVYGAAGPDAFDCSGLVQMAFASIGHPVGRTTVNQENAGTVISVAEAKAGDLVFWGSHGSTYHVGISTGDGAYIHAPVPGDVVQIATVASYTPDFALRVL
ncbi:C40 family peptidase [Candidatus Enterococcus mansonii]|uniref:NlpC/P60 domain-containing protein n=1 Tax=Candidatus Enterococcus mansonii TaxID=1834181 RepID=A0A242CHQ2_9ENTE|nr:C40 family peptidase [Enterococcus sp. 4G2_DIV0659]OTO09774.1 hypothetical protein A5880_000455 [Enterococcus sp. 4G2_DIV0659]